MSTTNANAGLPFGGVGIRHGRFPPQPHTHTHNTANKPSPSLSQHASPYQPQPYAPQQQPTQAQYPHHLFSTPTPPQISSVATVQNAARPQQSQMPPVLPGPRQRAPPPRQMQQQPAHPSYLQQSLNQPMPQPMNPQQLSQQALSQPSLTQQQPLSQPSLHQHSLSQHLPQPMNQTSMSQSLSQQSVSQTVQNDNSTILSQQTTPHAPAQPTLPPAQPQLSQVQQPPQVQKVQQVQQIQQQPTPPQPEPVEPAHDANQDEDMEGGSQDESGEGDLSMDPKVVDNTPFVPRRPMGPMMSAPPEGGSFPTLEAVHKYALSYCTSVGYAIVIGRSKKTVPGLKKVLFVCDRAGKPPRRVTPENRKRKTTSRKCDCQFGFFAIEQRTQWVVRYRPDSMHLQHNHGPSESPLLHPAARKLDSKMISTVKSLKESGVGVSQTLEVLQQENPHVPLLPRDIYNARAAINRNPTKIATGLAENRPAIYSKPHPSAEERIRADLRKELAQTREELKKLKEESKKEIADLKKQIKDKDSVIRKFEQFIDICNQRVMVNLTNNNDDGTANPTT
ncbi:hypothetical protein V8F06_006958 [Rhypophila decipiens]